MGLTSHDSPVLTGDLDRSPLSLSSLSPLPLARSCSSILNRHPPGWRGETRYETQTTHFVLLADDRRRGSPGLATHVMLLVLAAILVATSTLSLTNTGHALTLALALIIPLTFVSTRLLVAIAKNIEAVAKLVAAHAKNLEAQTSLSEVRRSAPHQMAAVSKPAPALRSPQEIAAAHLHRRSTRTRTPRR